MQSTDGVLQLNDGTFLQGGKYQIVKFISNGGFGCTYEARHVMLGRRIAIKEFFPQDFCYRDESTSGIVMGTTNSKESVAKLLRKFVGEAQALSMLSHPGIVKVSDVFEENGTAYFVMDYIEGRSLSDLLKERGKLSEAEALNYIRQVADALAYVHSHDRLHLDIKPGNIMIDNQGNAILIDFGASKHYDSKTGDNTTSMLGIKTRGFAPPEQAANGFTKFSPPTDIYALGATFYKLITDITPPDSNSITCGDKTLEPLPDSISAPTRNAIMAAMTLKRADRPQSIAEFLAILNDSASNHVAVNDKVKKQQVKNNNEVEKKPAKSKGGLLWIILGVVFLTLVAAGALFMLNRGEQADDIVVKEDQELGQIDDNDIVQNEENVADDDVVEPVADNKGSDVTTETEKPQSSVSVSQPTGFKNNHGYVDLGLSVKWADRNIGGSEPTSVGNHFAWGETVTKNSYTKENNTSNEKGIGDIKGSDRDAAHTKWGGPWRLPTETEFRELKKMCTWTWDDKGNGYIVKGPNGNSIYLPAAGWRENGSLSGVSQLGYYWSSTPEKGSSEYSYFLGFSRSGILVNSLDRSIGRSVRPVCD